MSVSYRMALRSAAPIAALAAAVAVLVIAFAWPTSHLAPRHVPVAISGSPDFVSRTTAELRSTGAGAFDVQVAPDAATAERMLQHDAVDGVFEETRSGPQLRLAAAGRPKVAQLLGDVEAKLLHSPARITDDVAAPRDDPGDAVFAIAGLPTMLGAIAVGVILTSLPGSRLIRVVRILGVALVSGVALTLVMNTWFGALTGSWWAVAGCYALGIGAVASAVGGLHSLFGRVGALGVAAVMMLLGNPLSSASSAPELLPNGWSDLGQALPPGALTSGLRAISFYGNHGASPHLFVLGAWVVVGLLLLVAGQPDPARRRNREPAPSIAETAAPLIDPSTQAQPSMAIHHEVKYGV